MAARCTISSLTRYQLETTSTKMRCRPVFGSLGQVETTAWAQEDVTAWGGTKSNGSRTSQGWYLRTLTSQMVLLSCTMLCRNTWLSSTTILYMVKSGTTVRVKLLIQDCSRSLCRWALFNGPQLVQTIAQISGVPIMESISHTGESQALVLMGQSSCCVERGYSICQSTGLMDRWTLTPGSGNRTGQ